jgi:DNA-binding Lrp family transcriptional regulator
MPGSNDLIAIRGRYRHDGRCVSLAIRRVRATYLRAPMENLIALLQHNPLMPRADLARLLAMSEEDVNARIAQLEKEGVILGYQTVINREVWNPDTVTAVIEVKVTPERDGGFDRIASRISKFDEVQSCYLMSGGYDLLVLVEADNLRQVAAFVSEKLSTIEAVVSTATRFRLKTYKENGAFHHFETTAERLAVSP